MAMKTGGKGRGRGAKGAGVAAIPLVLELVRYLQDADNRQRLSKAMTDARRYLQNIDAYGRLREAGSGLRLKRTPPKQRKAAKALVKRMGEPGADLDRVSSDILLLGSAAVKPLCKQLKNPVAPVREKAAWLLGEFGELDGLVALVEASGDPSPGVREQVEASTRRILEAHREAGSGG